MQALYHCRIDIGNFKMQKIQAGQASRLSWFDRLTMTSSVTLSLSKGNHLGQPRRLSYCGLQILCLFFGYQSALSFCNLSVSLFIRFTPLERKPCPSELSNGVYILVNIRSLRLITQKLCCPFCPKDLSSDIVFHLKIPSFVIARLDRAI